MLPGAMFVDLSVYDVRGRRVRTLARSVHAEGSNAVVWDGTDSRGRKVGSGIYFYRLRTRDQELGRSMTLLR